MKAYYKDIWRTVKHNKKRFFSLMLITILGVTMLSGLRAVCRDLRITADAFYDEQNLYDICVVSTLGLTDEDVQALAALEEIDKAEGTYSENVKVWIGEQNKSAQIKLISEEGINTPYVQEGQLPTKADEIAVTQNFLEVTGKQIGDTVVIDEEEETSQEEDSNEEVTPNFKVTEYTITGVVLDAANVNSQQEMMSFRSNSSADYTFFVLPEAVESDIYTAVYLTVKDSKDLQCYSDAYEKKIQGIVDKINTELKEEREQARYDAITGEALEELALLLGMSKIPEYIEAYDISHTGGSDNVAGMVVFKDGKPLKAAYRRFAIKGFSGQDDYRSMNEVLSRRFEEYYAHKEKGETVGFARLPDLILLDGGKGQVNAVLPLLKEYNIDVPVFGMVKNSKHRTSAISTAGGRIDFNARKKAFQLVTNIQDEVHRFSVAYHHKKHTKSALTASLTDIKGIGEKKAKNLIIKFKTMDAIRNAAKAELMSVPGITEANAIEIIKAFRGE